MKLHTSARVGAPFLTTATSQSPFFAKSCVSTLKTSGGPSCKWWREALVVGWWVDALGLLEALLAHRLHHGHVQSIVLVPPKENARLFPVAERA